MDFALSAEQRLIVDSARAFVERELYPLEDQIEQLGHVPPEIHARVRSAATAAGFYAANVPAELGGGGLGTLDATLLDRELGRANYALQNLVARPSNILRACTGGQVGEYLLPTVRGERLECLALTEPEAGSDLRSMRTTAVREGAHWRINGIKHFISRADVADYAILFAATGTDESGGRPRRRITAFLVDKGLPGFTVRDGYRGLCHPGYRNAILEFTDCRVPAGNVLGEVDRGFDVANTWLGTTRLQVAAMALGRAYRALDAATDWAANRRQFDRTIGSFQGVSFKLADMKTELVAAELLTFRAAWLNDQGAMRPEDASMAKLAATEMLGRLADSAVQVLGGMGVMLDTPVARIWRDARVERIWDGTSEIQRHIISRAMLRPLER